MKIVFAAPDRTYCLRLPLWLVCNRVGAALLARSLRRAGRLPDGSVTAAPRTGLTPTGQARSLLRALGQSKQTLQSAALPLLDMESGDGYRFTITL